MLSAMLLERLMFSSDVFTVYVCKQCGFIGYADWCQVGGSVVFVFFKKEVVTVASTYACKLLFQELQSMNVSFYSIKA